MATRFKVGDRAVDIAGRATDPRIGGEFMEGRFHYIDLAPGYVDPRGQCHTLVGPTREAVRAGMVRVVPCQCPLCCPKGVK